MVRLAFGSLAMAVLTACGQTVVGGPGGTGGGVTCTPNQNCTAVGAQCGEIDDGCGGVWDCGGCPPGLTCGLGGPNVCGEISCGPQSCAAVGVVCGQVDDGCGGTLFCGDCSPDMVCTGGGQCECLPGLVDCDGECVDTSHDQNHCGGCGISCPPAMVCQLGACLCGCPPPTVCCDVCADLANDPMNCGTCGHACPAGAVCINGVCL